MVMARPIRSGQVLYHKFRKLNSCIGIRRSLLEPDDSFEHQSVELSAVADMIHRIPCELLLHVFELGHDHRREEHAGAHLPPVRSDVTADSRKLSSRLVVADGREQLVVRPDAVNRVNRILPDFPVGRFGRGAPLRAR